MNDKDITKLVESAKKGNNESFAKLYAHFANNVRYFALRITKNQYDADDVVQETMISLYKNLKTLKNPKAISSFINTTAYNHSLMLIRKRKDCLTDDDSIFEEDFDEDEDFIPESYLENKELRREIISILDELPDTLRATMVMHYFEDLSIKEIADTVKLTEEAIRVRLFRGRERIKEAIKSQGLKGVVMTLMSVPVLSKILTMEAKASFDASVQTSNWIKIATAVGISAKEISSTAGLAALSTSTIAESSKLKNITRGVATTKGLIATVIAIGVVGTGVAFGTQNVISKNNPDMYSSEKTTEEKTLAKIVNTKTGEVIGSEELYIQTFLQDSVTKQEKEGTEENVKKSQDNSEAEDIIKRGNNLPLKYSLGSSITIQNIINDSQISTVHGSEIIVTSFENINKDKTGEYIVYLQSKKDNRLSQRVVIIISIE